MTDCQCLNCEDPATGGRCFRRFCSVCLAETGDDSKWGAVCDECLPHLGADSNLYPMSVVTEGMD